MGLTTVGTIRERMFVNQPEGGVIVTTAVTIAPNPAIISWALQRAGKSPSDLESIGKHSEEWLSGKRRPTIKQVQKIAAKTHVPFPYFYGDDIPAMALQIPDFRTTYSGNASTPSPELYDTINLMQSRQDWLSSFRSDIGAEKLEFVGKYAFDKNPRQAADEIRRLLHLEDGWARYLKADEAVRRLRETIEQVGVCTCTGSYFHHNSRPYDVSEFRGFVLADDYAPIIFVNTKDSKSAQLFTLVHEFAHLLFNETGVDDLVYEIPEKEDLCDFVAAEVLVPTPIVYAVFDRQSSTKAIATLRNMTKASEIVCLRRAHELKCISRDEYFKIYADYKRKLEEASAAGASSVPGSPSYYVLKKSTLGKLFSDSVYEGVKSEHLLFSDAYRLTDMKASKFEEFYRQEGMYL